VNLKRKGPLNNNTGRHTLINLPKTPLVLTNSHSISLISKNEVKENIGQISSFTHPELIKSLES